jgi:hypothetical protein
MKLKLIFFVIAFIFSFIPFSIAGDFGHSAEEIWGGYFDAGNFSFYDSLFVPNTLNATTLCIGSVCADSWAKYVDFDSLNLTYALNDTFSQYDTWNFNQSINLQAWVLNQNYLTSVAGSDNTNLAYLNNSQTFSVNQTFVDSVSVIGELNATTFGTNLTFNNDVIVNQGNKGYYGNGYIYYNGTDLILSG